MTRLLSVLRRLAGIRKSRRLRGTLRVFIFLLCLNLLLSAVVLRSAYADAERTLDRLANGLMRELGPVVDTPQAMLINGNRMYLSSATTQLGVQEVMGIVDAHCRERSGNFAAELRNVPELMQRLPRAARDLEGLALARSDQDAPNPDAAQIACIAQPGESTGWQHFLDRLGRFLDSGDLAALGGVRYFRAQRTPHGPTHVLGIWTDGAFNLWSLFPETGDAAGSDSAFVPRPAASRRLLVAETAEGHHAVRIYESTEKPAPLLAAYERELPRRGWALAPVSMDEKQLLHRTPNARLFLKHGAMVLVATSDEVDGNTGVTLLEMGTRGDARGESRWRLGDED